MRYYDISGRVAVFNLAHAVTVTPGSSPATTTLSVGQANMGYVDRTGYYSYIAQLVFNGTLVATNTVSFAMKLQSSSDGTNWYDVTGMNSVTPGANTVTSVVPQYKQLYLNSTGSTAGNNLVSAGFQDQPWVYTVPASGTSALVDARIFGSLRDMDVVGKYIAPYVTIIDTKTGAATADSAMKADVNLLLGGGDQMPVFQAGTMGAVQFPYYSQGQ